MRRFQDFYRVPPSSTMTPKWNILGDGDNRFFICPYYDFANASALTWIKEKLKDWTSSSHVPTAFAMLPADIIPAPREWANRFFTVQRWTEMPRRGHFATLEEPDLLAKDIREFFRPLRRRCNVGRAR